MNYQHDQIIIFTITYKLIVLRWLSWSWSYGSWIYNNLCN